MPDLRVSLPEPCGEKWEGMTPVGCDRVCARCDKVIHDLSHYTIEEAETLLGANADSCVRARVGKDGVIDLAPNLSGGMRHMVLVVGAAAGLLTAGVPATAREKRHDGAITGKVHSTDFKTRVTATDTQGKEYKAWVKPDGRYRITKVPDGAYKLTFVPGCGSDWTIDKVVVAGGVADVPDTIDRE